MLRYLRGLGRTVDEILSAPLYLEPVVSLHLYHMPTHSGLTQGFWRLLGHHPHLQSLRITLSVELAEASALGYILAGNNSAQLRQLELGGKAFTHLSIEALTGLTKLILSSVDYNAPLLRLVMPQSLQVLRYEGSCLFGRHDNGTSCQVHNLQDLTCLTELSLYRTTSSYLHYDCHPCLPPLPASLRYLAVQAWCFVHSCDWSGLSVCKQLQRLTLPGGFKRTAELDRYISSARHLHVVDEEIFNNRMEPCGAWWDDTDKCWHGTRMFNIDIG